MQPLIARVEMQAKEIAEMRLALEDAQRRISTLEGLVVGDPAESEPPGLYHEAKRPY